jgi:hypothetical protein
MNEQIKQLVKQADLGWAIQRANIQGDAKDLERLNKFAELIIQECAEFANEHNSDVEGVTLGIGTAIKKHFGVNNE